MRLKIGTKSVLFGAHCIFIHPWFVALAWWKLYGFPYDPRLWFAFFLHDIGYIGKPNMDGPEGELHPYQGALIMGALFGRKWFEFTLYHSRYLAKKEGAQYSRLCVADKLSIALTPGWLYLPAVNATGEINEYLKHAQCAESDRWKPTGYDQKKWHRQLCDYMTRWVEVHKEIKPDSWTSENRHAVTDGGVWQ
jgi:hypothetical protein